MRLADRLALTLILWVGGIWIVSVLGVVAYVDREINLNFDSEMMESAHRMIDIAVHDYDLAVVSGRAPASALPLIGREPLIDDDPVVFQLVDGDGRLLMRSREAPAQRFAIAPAARGGFAESGEWRVYTVAHPSRPLVLHLADPLAERRQHRWRTLLGLVLPLIAILPLVAWLLRRTARRELEVLHRLESQIATRGSADLSRLALDGQPLELRSVGEHVNRLLERLGAALDAERALAANAAHELRTPLAALRMRLQTALEDGPSRVDVEAALRSVEDLGHRAEKLLQLSRAESAAALGREPLDLIRIVATVVDEFWAQGPASRRIDLSLEDTEPGPALGDADTLAIALRNLIENALRYGGGSRVEVAVLAPATLAVRDRGPGVPAPQLKALRERHARQSGGAAVGYGLGFSIIGAIVERHGARLELSSPRLDRERGFEARIVLPRAGPGPGRPATSAP